jgi:hypothetical protein
MTDMTDRQLQSFFDEKAQPLRADGSLDETGDTAEKRILAAADPWLHEWADDVVLSFNGRNWGGDWNGATGADINGAPAEYVHGHMSPLELLRENPAATVDDYAAWLNTFLIDEFEEKFQNY